MTSVHKINDALYTFTAGDVTNYFDQVDNMILDNDGKNEFNIVSTDCYATAAPVHSDQYTRFAITDTSFDIIDISKGYISMDITFNYRVNIRDIDSRLNGGITDATEWNNFFKLFIGFKSGAQIISAYNIYSNGRLTNCKNTKAKYEQALVYNCKAKEERIGRPGLYSPHKNVLNMSETVCGVYVDIPVVAELNQDKQAKLQLLIQVDDIAPLAALSLYPRYLFGSLELELSCNLINNMVFCPIPFEDIAKNKIYKDNTEIGTNLNATDGLFIADAKLTYLNTIRSNAITDSRFHMCGDWARCLAGIKARYTGTTGSSENTANGTLNGVYVSVTVSDLVITKAQSYIHGFNLLDQAKEEIRARYSENKFKAPAQWIDHYTFSQTPSTSGITTSIQIPMFNASQVIMTFPSSANEATGIVSRNPHLNGIQCHIGSRVIPDKYMSTLDKSHAEMILSALALDSLFSAPTELLEALTVDRKTKKTVTVKRKDDSDYMLVLPLERYGAGCFCDGLSGASIPINFNATYREGTSNCHFFELDVANSPANDVSEKNAQKYKTPSHNVNLYVIQDCFWVFTPNGGEFVKDIFVNNLKDIE